MNHFHANGEWEGVWQIGQDSSHSLPLSARSAGKAKYSPGWEPPQGKIEWYIFYWIETGCLSLYINDEWIQFRQNQSLILPPGSFIRSTKQLTHGSYRWLTTKSKGATHCIMPYLGLPLLAPFNSGTCPTQDFDHLESLIKSPDKNTSIEASILVYKLLVGSMSDTLTSEKTGFVAKAIELIHLNYTQSDLNINSIADQIKMHRSRFSREFSKEHGISPSQYLLRLRIKHALNLMKTTDLLISDIARKSGYEDPAYFTRIFKQEMGYSPKDFRNLNS